MDTLNEVAEVAKVTLEAVRIQASQDHDLLTRIDEKVTAIGKRMDEFQSNLDTHKKEETTLYVTKESFEPVKRITYGLVGVILVAVVGAVLTLILR